MEINVLCYLRNSARKYSDKIFLVEGQKSYTFGDVLFLAIKLAEEIKSIHSEHNRPIPVISSKSIDGIVIFFAIIASKNVYCPIDPGSGPDRIRKIISDLSPALIYLERGLRWSGEETKIEISDLRSQIPQERPAVDDLIVRLDDLTGGQIDMDPAYIIHTSGSTGVPKGVIISHRSIIDYIEWAKNAYPYSSVDKMLNQAPFHFDNSTLDIYLALAVGAELHIVPDSLYTFPLRLIEYMNKMGITAVFWVPSVMINIANLKLLDQLTIRSLNKILFAGEAMPVRQINYWVEKLPHCLFSNLYGPTEITVDCTYFNLAGPWTQSDTLPIGFPCRNSGIVILTGQNLAANAYESGELCVRGSSLALGYWNMNEKTQEVFTRNPLVPEYEDRIYRTGDLVYKDSEGLIYFLGRKDTQIKYEGYRIELGEIEAALSSMKKIQQVAVLYIAEKMRIVACYVSDREVNSGEFKEYLQQRLPSYMHPHLFIRKESLKLNANGKLDKLTLSAEIREMI